MREVSGEKKESKATIKQRRCVCLWSRGTHDVKERKGWTMRRVCVYVGAVGGCKCVLGWVDWLMLVAAVCLCLDHGLVRDASDDQSV